ARTAWRRVVAHRRGRWRPRRGTMRPTILPVWALEWGRRVVVRFWAAVTDGRARDRTEDRSVRPTREQLVRRRLAVENRDAFRIGLTVREHSEVLLDRVLVLDLVRPLVEVGIHLGIEVRASLEDELELARLVALHESQDRGILQSAVVGEEELITVHVEDRLHLTGRAGAGRLNDRAPCRLGLEAAGAGVRRCRAAVLV